MSLGEPNLTAIAGFLLFVSATPLITCWASRRTKTTEHFHAAGRSIHMSAASLLGIAGLVALSGFDGLVYSISHCRTIAQSRALHLYRRGGDAPAAEARIAAATGSVAVVSFYLIAQMVGAGNLVRLLFGIDYSTAVVIVGVVMLAYVIFGGMIATTWVQIVKAMPRFHFPLPSAF